MADDGEAGRVGTNIRMLLILEAVAHARSAVTPTEINARVKLPKQSIHRLCERMVAEGFLAREPGDRGLVPGDRARVMARGLMGVGPIAQSRRAILERLSRSIGETVNFVVPEIDGMTYLDRVETHWIFRVELPIGSHVPFHCTASGKCYLASLTPRERRSLLADRNEARTPNTIVSRAALEAEIADIAAKGYALDREELFEGMVALAVPVIGADGVFQAAIALHGPVQRLAIESLPDHLPAMREAAEQLAAL